MFDNVPINQVVRDGDRVSVNCSNAGATSISWRYNEQVVTSGENGVEIASMFDSSTLTINMANHALHDGFYQCVAVLPGTIETANFSIAVQCK